jgi:hypothetical protein
MKGTLFTVLIMALIFILTWSALKWFADVVSDYKIIKPKNGVECIIVSRLLTTSVACYSVSADDQ